MKLSINIEIDDMDNGIVVFVNRLSDVAMPMPENSKHPQTANPQPGHVPSDDQIEEDDGDDYGCGEDPLNGVDFSDPEVLPEENNEIPPVCGIVDHEEDSKTGGVVLLPGKETQHVRHVATENTCPECGKEFVKDRSAKTQKYCGKSCRRKVSNRNFIAKANAEKKLERDRKLAEKLEKISRTEPKPMKRPVLQSDFSRF